MFKVQGSGFKVEKPETMKKDARTHAVIGVAMEVHKIIGHGHSVSKLEKICVFCETRAS